MSNIRKYKSIISEYGIRWTINRSLYSLKLKSMRIAPITEKMYEKKTAYPSRLDVFCIDIVQLRNFIRNELNECEKSELICLADKVCDGIIKGFSSIQLDYGSPIQWQLNPITNRNCDSKKKWYRIPDFDKERGDIKVVWEASRFSHFITLARAYLLTDNIKYYQAFHRQLGEWLENNTYGCGANFKCGQECSFRMANALLAYTVFNGCMVATDSDMSNMKDLIDRCYRKILSNFFYAHRCIRNNHTISELLGMIVGAWCCGDKKRMSKAYRWLEKVICEQFTDDGGYRQFSFNYTRLALQDLEAILSISPVTGIRLSNTSLKKIEKAAWLLYQCQDDTGDVPNYGNNDGALVFPVTSCGYHNFIPVINTAYALTTGKQLYNRGKHQEELIWFSGGRDVASFEMTCQEKVSSAFDKAGLFTMRNNNCWAMMVANEYDSRPAHMDQNHFDLWVRGSNVLCDAGTYSYASEEGISFVKNEHHNTVSIEGTSQMNIEGHFLIYDWTKRQLSQCDSTSFSCEIISSNGYKHSRSVTNLGNRFDIEDEVDRDNDVIFNTPCDVVLFDKNSVGLELNGRLMCKISSNGKISIRKTERSVKYLEKENINSIWINGKKGIKTITRIDIA